MTWYVSLSLSSLWLHYVLQSHDDVLLFMNLQRHDIVKRRLDAYGNVVDTRKDGIGHTKVSFLQISRKVSRMIENSFILCCVLVFHRLKIHCRDMVAG